MDEVEGCKLPQGLLYDVENDVWAREISENRYILGITTPLLFMIGKLTNLRPRNVGTEVKRGGTLALVETSRYSGALISPMDCTITKVNDKAVVNPLVVIQDTYREGWIVEVEKKDESPTGNLLGWEKAINTYREKILRNRIICFKTYPDHRITALGETCEKILTKVGDYFFKFVKPGETLHVITQDPATEVDMIKWAQDMGQELVEIKRQDKIIHVIYRRTKP